jgi:hypothetical protein
MSRSTVRPLKLTLLGPVVCGIGEVISGVTSGANRNPRTCVMLKSGKSREMNAAGHPDLPGEALRGLGQRHRLAANHRRRGRDLHDDALPAGGEPDLTCGRLEGDIGDPKLGESLPQRHEDGSVHRHRLCGEYRDATRLYLKERGNARRGGSCDEEPGQRGQNQTSSHDQPAPFESSSL